MIYMTLHLSRPQCLYSLASSLPIHYSLITLTSCTTLPPHVHVGAM